MRRAFLLLACFSFLAVSCSIITQLEQPVARDSGAGDADADGDHDDDSDVDADADTDQDEPRLDGDLDSEVDAEVAPLCELAFELVHTAYRPRGTLLTMEFDLFGQPEHREAVVAGIQEETDDDVFKGISLLFRNETVAPRTRAFDTSLVVAGEPSQAISAARIGQFDWESEPEVVLFTEWRADGRGRLLIVDSAHSTPYIPEGDFPFVGHGLKNGVLLHFTSERRFVDIAAIAWDGGASRGVLYSWEREDQLDDWRAVPPSEAFVTGGQPERMLPIDTDDNGDDELVISIHEPAALSLYDWNDGDSRLEEVNTMRIGCSPRDMVAGDIDDDDQPEILMACGHGTLHVAYTEHRQFVDSGGHDAFREREVYALAVADLDDNGTLDLVTHDRFEISVFCGDGWGDFTLATTLSADVGESTHPLLGIVDVDSDGHLDIVEVNGTETGGGISTYLARPVED